MFKCIIVKIIIKFGISFTADYMSATLPVAAICHSQIREMYKFHVCVINKLRNLDSVGSHIKSRVKRNIIAFPVAT